MIIRITGGRATERARNRLITLTVVVLAAGPLIAAPASAETTLEKISRTGILTIGTRTGSPPFGFINDKKEWVGFSIDLVEQAVVPTLSKKLGKPIKVEKKESTPATRAVALGERRGPCRRTMTDTPERRKQVDFSIAFFLTGAQFLVKKGSRSGSGVGRYQAHRCYEGIDRREAYPREGADRQCA
jgi:polar amino acid transport system substrate-binding protein